MVFYSFILKLLEYKKNLKFSKTCNISEEFFYIFNSNILAFKNKKKCNSIKYPKLIISKFINLINFKNIESNSRPEESLNEEDLPRLLNELEELQGKFDASAVNKHKLHIELESCIQRMEAATSIIERYFYI